MSMTGPLGGSRWQVRSWNARAYTGAAGPTKRRDGRRAVFTVM
jgi:hypothetical protein